MTEFSKMIQVKLIITAQASLPYKVASMNILHLEFINFITYSLHCCYFVVTSWCL